MSVPRMILPTRAPLRRFLSLCLTFLAVMILAGCGKKSVTAPAPKPPAQWLATSGPPSAYQVRCLAARGTVLFAGTDQGAYRSTNEGESWSACGLTGLDIFTLGFSGTHVYAATTGDFRKTYRGLYYTINDGVSWLAILPDMFVSSVAIRDSAVFAGTMDSGVFRRMIGQSDWTSVNSGLTNTNVHSLSVSGACLFAGTYGSGAFRSTDYGDSWVAANGGFDSTDVSDFAVVGANVFVATSRGVLRSADQGVTWVAVNNGLASTSALDMAVDGSSLFVATGAGGVFRTVDNGANWTAFNSGLPEAYVCALAVGATDLFAGTSQSGVWRYPLR